MIGYTLWGSPSQPAASVSPDAVAPLTREVRPALPLSSVRVDRVVSETIREVTAYNVGDPAQTYGDPCHGASGENICAALAAGAKRCAANFVALGTRLKIDHVGICKVTDRMNARYRNRVDVAMELEKKHKAIEFGLQKLRVKILES